MNKLYLGDELKRFLIVTGVLSWAFLQATTAWAEEGFKLETEWSGAHPQLLHDGGGQAIRAIVKLGTCTGTMIGVEGLFLTSRRCIHRVLNDVSSAKSLIDDGFVAKTQIEELRLPETVHLTLKQQDVTEEILRNKEVKGAEAQNFIDAIDRALNEKEQACRSQTGHTCRVVEVAAGMQYILTEEISYPDVRLVYTPSLKDGFPNSQVAYPALKGNNSPFALLRIYDGGKPLRPKYSFAVSKNPELKLNEPVIVAGMTDIYKRYHWTSQHMMLYETGLMTPIEDWLGLYIPYLRQLASKDRNIHRKYQSSLLSLGEWYDRIAMTPVEYKKLELETNRTAIERGFLQSIQSNSSLLDAYQNLTALAHDYLLLTRHRLRWESLTKNKGLGWVEKWQKLRKSPDDQARDGLAFSLRQIDAEVEVQGIVMAFEVIRRYPYVFEKTTPIVAAIYHENDKKKRETQVRTLVQSSKLFGDAKLDQIRDDDSLVKFYQEIESILSLYKSDAIEKEERILSAKVFPAYSAYLKTQGKPFYPAIGSQLPGYLKGKIHSQSAPGSQFPSFETDIDACFRDLKGSPTINSKGELLGIYVDVHYTDEFDVNFYYDPNRAIAEHLSIEAVRNQLRKAGIESILK